MPTLIAIVDYTILRWLIYLSNIWHHFQSVLFKSSLGSMKFRLPKIFAFLPVRCAFLRTVMKNRYSTKPFLCRLGARFHFIGPNVPTWSTNRILWSRSRKMRRSKRCGGILTTKFMFIITANKWSSTCWTRKVWNGSWNVAMRNRFKSSTAAMSSEQCTRSHAIFHEKLISLSEHGVPSHI